MAAINCQALSFAYNWISRKRFGITCGNLPIDAILSNFKLTTGCDTIEECKIHEPCVDESFVICNFKVANILSSISPSGLVILQPSGLSGGIAPYIGLWNYDDTKFDLVDGGISPAVHLQVKEGITITTEEFEVTVIDNEECVATASSEIVFPQAIIGSIVFNPVNLFNGVPYVGTLTISYTGGNSIPYSSFTIQSTGILGLTAVLRAGTLGVTGTLVFDVTGTPIGQGDAIFDMVLFGQPVTATANIQDSTCIPTSITDTLDDYVPLTDSYNVLLQWVNRPGVLSYTIQWDYDSSPVAPLPVEVLAPNTDYIINIPAGDNYSGTIVVNCNGVDSSIAIPFSGSVPASTVCIPVTSVSHIVGAFDTINGTYPITVSWASPNINHTVEYPTGVFTPVSVNNFQLDVLPATNITVKIITDCGVNGYSTEVTYTFISPPIALPGAPPDPVLIDFSVLSSGFNQWASMWFSVHPDINYVTIKQAPIFGSFISNSGQLTPGLSNGQFPLPAGFSSNDVYFNNNTPPVGYLINSSGRNQIRLSLTTLSGPFIGTYDFDIYKNIETSYGRQSAEEYVPIYDLVKPFILLSSPGAGALDATVNPNGNPFTGSDIANIFLLDSSGNVNTIHYAVNSLAHNYTGLLPGTYLVYAEFTVGGASFNNWVTAVPNFITIA